MPAANPCRRLHLWQTELVKHKVEQFWGKDAPTPQILETFHSVLNAGPMCTDWCVLKTTAMIPPLRHMGDSRRDIWLNIAAADPTGRNEIDLHHYLALTPLISFLQISV